MKSKIQVITVENRSGRSRAGLDYSMDVCQCAVFEEGADGKERCTVGELVLPKGHAPVSPGFYEAVCGVSVSPDKRVGGRLIQLIPINPARPAASAPKP